ncbi:MAG: hypothetical protein Q8P41_24660 [Pseudomonadota bacterium]|nr:hypothetical protein [Pseudomonadota bacterium]
MSVRDDLALIGWLAALAPEAAATPGGGARAIAALLGVFREAAQLDVALGNGLRRAAATAVLQMPERVDPIDAQRAILADRAGFAALLDRGEPALVAVAAHLDGLAPTRGRGARLAPLVLDAFRVQSRDLFPREDMGGIGLAIGVVEALARGADPHRRLQLERELAALHGRRGAPDAAAAIAGAGEGGTALLEADALAARGELDAARARLAEARRRYEAAADLAGIGAVLRREAALVGPEDRVELLRKAIVLAREAGDPSGQAEGLEELSRAYAETARMGAAVAALGEVARLARLRVDAAGEARALQLAGRLLCEAPSGEDDPGRGLVLLLHAGDIAASVDPVVADLVRRYVTGFQYTLNDRQFAEIEPILDEVREDVVGETFARYRTEHPEALP